MLSNITSWFLKWEMSIRPRSKLGFNWLSFSYQTMIWLEWATTKYSPLSFTLSIAECMQQFPMISLFLFWFVDFLLKCFHHLWAPLNLIKQAVTLNQTIEYMHVTFASKHWSNLLNSSFNITSNRLAYPMINMICHKISLHIISKSISFVASIGLCPGIKCLYSNISLFCWFISLDSS